jgi:hypothetical protein
VLFQFGEIDSAIEHLDRACEHAGRPPFRRTRPRRGAASRPACWRPSMRPAGIALRPARS